jgi:transcriptional regulator with XRE-family HTH domain
MILYRLLGSAIHAARRDRGLTLAQLGAEVGVSRGYLSGVETGRVSQPSDKLLRRISEVLGLDPGRLIAFRVASGIPSDADLKALLDLIIRLEDEKRDLSQ